jgi:UDP-N-acetylmuramate dehydrogenase
MGNSVTDILNSNGVRFVTSEDLSKHSTMRVGGMADFFIEIKSEEELKNFLAAYKEIKNTSLFIVGEGSNTLFTGDFNGIILKMSIKGIDLVEEDDEFITYKVSGGENWHNFVKYCVDKNLSGIENLALIPGTVGAAPVQNIAAYGQVQEDVFLNLEAYNIKTGEKEVFDEPECEFAYRSSVFKTSKKDSYIITSVTYKLKKAAKYIPELSYHSRYESLQGILSEIAKEPYTLKDIFNAVIEIRTRKLPKVDEVGTLGSFFVNPFINKVKLSELQEKFPDIQFYPVEKMQYPGLSDEELKQKDIVKIPAGWLLEELGWRGKTKGNVGTSPKHALCVVINGPATGKEVHDFVKEMKASVFEATGIKLQTEINIL